MKTAKRPSDKLRWCEICLLLLAAVFLLSGTLALGTQSRLADKVVRLHVLANSDEEADQALKLRVRDAVLARTRSCCASRQTAERRRRRCGGSFWSWSASRRRRSLPQDTTTR